MHIALVLAGIALVFEGIALAFEDTAPVLEGIAAVVGCIEPKLVRNKGSSQAIRIHPSPRIGEIAIHTGILLVHTTLRSRTSQTLGQIDFQNSSGDLQIHS